MLHANAIIELQDQATVQGHQQPESPLRLPVTPLLQLVLQQHSANFDLWHEEDRARDPNGSDHTIAEVKHTIDRLNQLRNDAVEQIDSLLLAAAGPQNPGAPLHSETPGLIVDRLSILALKIFHTAVEVERPSASDTHHQRNAARLAVLELQRADLAVCLDELWVEVLAGRRRFKLYRQMKMYNDPELNPVLYGAGAAPEGSSDGAQAASTVGD